LVAGPDFTTRKKRKYSSQRQGDRLDNQGGKKKRTGGGGGGGGEGLHIFVCFDDTAVGKHFIDDEVRLIQLV